MPKLTISQLRKIISEEVKTLKEGDREDQAASMATTASKLLKAIELFNGVASAKAKSNMNSSGTSLEKHLQETEKMLKRIVASPLEHVDGQKTISANNDKSLGTSIDGKTVSVKPNVKKKV